MRAFQAVSFALFIVFAASCGDESGSAGSSNSSSPDAGLDVGGEDLCDGGTCTPLAELGEACDTADECASERCEAFGDVSRCTEACDGMCPGEGLACFDGLCTPADYCENPDGIGDGPGCDGTVCDSCATEATCVQGDDGAYSCECPGGYDDTNGDGTACSDIDECADGTDTCDDAATCTNEPGSFSCACSAGYDDTNGDGTACTDVDECADETDTCDDAATCTNEPGGFSCACPAGYDDTNGDGSVCTDIDECADGTDDCGQNAACNNTPGSFTCGCPAGYDDVNGDGTVCTDIDECSDGTNTCDSAATCTNEPGSFSCACPAGYDDVNGDGSVCTDIDECTAGTDNCDANAVCANQPGGFSCTCPMGFSDTNGDGTLCTDINECSNGTNNCDSDATCSNEPGSFTCSCNAGFTGNGVICDDVDECTRGLDNCDSVASCSNTVGSFTCTCPAGYSGDGTVCTDINECSNGTAMCDTNATCTNEPGTFSCNCNADYYGSGDSCRRANSCQDLHLSWGATANGTYLIDADGAGPAPAVTVYCDMQTDGGGYTFYKVSYGSQANAVQAESHCAARGMQLFIPRTNAHKNSALNVARSGAIGPSGTADYMRILGIYPNFNGANCVNRGFNSGSCTSWSASDNERYYVSSRTNITEPNGDNTTNSSMYYSWQSNNEVLWYNDIVSPGYTSAFFMCDVADKF